MNIIEKLKSLSAVRILYSEKIADGYARKFFDSKPQWLRAALRKGKIILNVTPQLDYASWVIPNEYGDPVVFFHGDYIVHDGNGKIYGLESEVVDILNRKL